MFEAMLPTIRGAPDLRVEVEKRRAEVEALLAPIDAIHLLGNLALGELSFNPQTYSESEHPGAAHVMELASAILATRPGREGTRTATPPIGAHILDPLRRLLREMVLLEGLVRYRKSGALDGHEFGEARGRAAMQHLMLRAPGWPWQEGALMLDLFGAPHVADRLRRELGFDAAAAVACTETIPSLLPERIQEHGHRAHEEGVEKALAWAEEAFDDRWKTAPPGFRDRAMTSLWALMHLGDALLFTAEDIGERADVPTEVAAAVIEALAIPFGQTGTAFEVAERVRERPYLDLGDGHYFCTVPGNDLWALRRVFESALKSGEAYSRHRGRWLERKAGAMLSQALEPDEIHYTVKLFPEGGGKELGEIDALLRFGDTVLTVEAKGATLKPGARRGGAALIDHLKKHVTKAAEQSSLARRALTRTEPIELRCENGTRLDLGERVREVHPIVVTLDDLSAVAPVLWELAGTPLMPNDVTIPWLVTLHELEHVCATVAWPHQFIHFLRRRSQLNDRADRFASEELDWWMLYLDTSLYFDDDERSEQRVRYLSQTDPLDAWVLSERGLRAKAKKPRQKLDQHTERLLEKLADERPPGWVPAACSLLDVSGESRKLVHRQIRAAGRRAAARHNVQRGAYLFEDVPGGFMLAWVVVTDEAARQLQDQLRVYVAERLEEFDVQRVLGIGLTPTSKRPYDALLVAEPAVWDG